jgi:tRNA pseudouridine55 synthase
MFSSAPSLVINHNLTTEDTERTEDYNRLMNGTLIIDKPAGITSHDVVARVRRIIGQRGVGHTGTLDPFATGVLVVLAGNATRLLQFLSGAEKEYEAVIRFGYATDTGDITGQPVDVYGKPSNPPTLHAEDIETAMASLRGEITQVPPMYSAKKVKGRKLYELARRGEVIERTPVQITISDFAVIETDESIMTKPEDGTRDLCVRVACSAGTYVRTLAEDLGTRLGVGAHLAALRRTRAGRFRIEDAVTLERLAELAEANKVHEVTISMDETVGHLPVVIVNESDVRRVTNGVDIEIESEHQNRQPIRLRSVSGELIAVGVYDASRRNIHPQVVLGE